jgi:hypothetical protein
MRTVSLLAIVLAQGSPPAAPHQTLVFREISVGAIVSLNWQTRSDYVIEDLGAATGMRLTVTHYALASNNGLVLDGNELLPKSWRVAGTETFEGRGSPVLSLQRVAQTVVDPVAVHAIGDHLDLTCTAHTQLVLEAGARPIYGGCESRPSKDWWKPAAKHAVTTWSCDSSVLTLEFAPAPGIEHVHENSDCLFQNGDYRSVR